MKIDYERLGRDKKQEHPGIFDGWSDEDTGRVWEARHPLTKEEKRRYKVEEETRSYLEMKAETQDSSRAASSVLPSIPLQGHGHQFGGGRKDDYQEAESSHQPIRPAVFFPSVQANYKANQVKYVEEAYRLERTVAEKAHQTRHQAEGFAQQLEVSRLTHATTVAVTTQGLNNLVRTEELAQAHQPHMLELENQAGQNRVDVGSQVEINKLKLLTPVEVDKTRQLNEAAADQAREMAQIDLMKEYRQLLMAHEAAVREKLFSVSFAHRLQGLVFRQIDIVTALSKLPDSPAKVEKLKVAHEQLEAMKGQLDDANGKRPLPGTHRKGMGSLPPKADSPANSPEDD